MSEIPQPRLIVAGAPLEQQVVPGACDNASVGVLIHDAGTDRWLMFQRVKFPAGVAPVAGHVFDEHAVPGASAEQAYRAAARAEVEEELGVGVVGLVDTGVGGWRPNRCRRPAGPRGTGHEWRVYSATVSGDLAPSPDEARHPQWFSRGQLQQLADLTITYALGHLSDEDWAARPGIEPVWVAWLAQLGLVQVDPVDLVLVDQLAARLMPAGDDVVAGGGVSGWVSGWGRAWLAPFVVLSVLLVVVVVGLTRWWLLPCIGVAAVAAVVLDWANTRRRGPASGSGWDAVALGVQLLALIGGVSVIVLVLLGLAGVPVPAWAVVR